MTKPDAKALLNKVVASGDAYAHQDLIAEIERLQRCEAALAEMIAASDNCVSTENDVEAMLRYGSADKAARAALAAPTEGKQ
jgi:hypothetical protein